MARFAAKLLAAAIAIPMATAAFAPTPAHADYYRGGYGYGRGGYGYGHGGYGHSHGGYGVGALVGGALLGLGVGSLLAAPYYAPPPVVYAPPPAYYVPPAYAYAPPPAYYAPAPYPYYNR